MLRYNGKVNIDKKGCNGCMIRIEACKEGVVGYSL
ncbi:MAG: hypothetical protein SBU_001532 [Candidatus Syntrophoarchaeum butanivorans]|uniref:Uncharacterized protein n=1 Tax=Candidatus Syntropharchaeum butanivorans TaxID=1839936 RepID=A0A1F2P336_9EURY|nr:MAG: hypothetical protein SBU_001532 [Candidatus Syntrophoarchaeum butanivorans]